jgi:predicted ArsR family transcriptional regulator
MDSKDFAQQLENLAALDDPVRRKLYLYVAGRGEDVSRDEAAHGTGVSRALAAFHLDKLVDVDLLQATFRRLRGRGGPGAGRPPKLYRRSSTQLDVSLPPRRYELAAHILAQALAQAPSEATLEALRNAAREWGRRLAGDVGGGVRGRPLKRATRALEGCGYEPHATTDDEGEVVLRNCPFDSVRTESRDLICAMNLALIEGLIDGLGVEGVRARLSPRPGMCCVTLRNSRAEE